MYQNGAGPIRVPAIELHIKLKESAESGWWNDRNGRTRGRVAKPRFARYRTAMVLLAIALAGGAPAPIVLATYAYPAYDRREALAPLADEIAAETGKPVGIALYPTPDALRDAIRAGQVDFAVTNLAAYAGAASQPAVRAIAVLDPPAATLDRYRGVLLVRRAAGVRDGADLNGKAGRLRYVEVLPGSTSGAMVQAAYLQTLGLAPTRFAAIDSAGSHDAALAALVEGRADVAALAETPWRRLQAERPEIAAGLVELWRSEGLPPGPVVCLERPSPRCDRVGRRLLGAGSGAAAAALARGWSETEGATRFIAPDPARYRPFLPR